ncbi:hypothetical protein ACVW1A_006960 [Bradyrhizobium sp. LB1.3]
MKKPPTLATPGASINYRNNSTVNVIDRDTSAQANSPVEIAHIGAIWKSTRDKRTCIQAGLKQFNGSPYCDLRVFELDAQGRMRATAKGITISPQRLMQLAKLVGDAARKAVELGLITAGSSS